MAGQKSKKANRINIKNAVYCVLQTDASEGTTYGDVTSLSPAMQVQLTTSLATGVLHGDGVQQENIAKITGIAMVLDVNKIPIENRAIILGNKYENGILQEKEGDEAPYIAVGYEVPETNGCKELIWLLKGRVQPYNSNVQQSTDSINFSTDSVTINFIPRDSDGLLRFFGDTANADLTNEQVKKWFKTGPSVVPSPGVGG